MTWLGSQVTRHLHPDDPWSFDYPERLDEARAHMVAALAAIDGKKHGVSEPESTELMFDQRENGSERKTAPAGNRGLTSQSELSGKEAGPIMLDGQSDRTPEARQNADLRHLQALLSQSIKKRDQLSTLIDKHWFVDDGDGNCRACNLPERNGRHAVRV